MGKSERGARRVSRGVWGDVNREIVNWGVLGGC